MPTISLMRRSPGRSRRLAVIISLLLLFSTLGISPIAQAETPSTGSIGYLSITTDNLTINALSNYEISFTAVTSIDNPTPDSIVITAELDELNSGFDLSAFDPQAVTLVDSASNTPIACESPVWDPANKILELKPSGNIAANTVLTLNLPGIKNPGTTGQKTVAKIYTKDTVSGALSQQIRADKIITSPSLLISPDTLTMDLDRRDRLIITMIDQLGNPVEAPAALSTYIYSYNSGQFYPDKADESQSNYFTIPQGYSSTEIYYHPTTIGSHQLYIYSQYYQGSYIGSTYSPYITVNPTQAIRLNMNWPTVTPTATAGEPVKVEIQTCDQAGNISPPSENLTVNLAAFSGYGSDEQSPSGRLLAADENGDLINPDTTSNSVIIPKDGPHAGIAWFYYVDNKATDSDYQVTLKATADSIGTITSQVTINPASSDHVKILSPSGVTSVSTNQRLPLEVQLQDRYDNLSDPQPPSLQVRLESAQGGIFYESQSSTTPYPSAYSITFSPSWQNEDRKTVYYTKTTATVTPDTITASASYLDPGSIEINVFAAPSISLSSPAQSEVKLFVPLAITLSSTPETDVAVQLSSDQPGYFFKEASNNVNAVNEVIIPAGSQSISIWYRPETVGEHKLMASTPFFGGTASEPALLDVIHAGQVFFNRIAASGPVNLVAGNKARVDIIVIDQYDNPVPQPSGGLTINLEATQSDGSPVNEASPTAKILAADADGNPTDTVTDRITIPEGASSAVFYYYDEKATALPPFDPPYQVQIMARADNLETCVIPVTICSANAFKAVIIPMNSTARPVNDRFELQVVLQDQYGAIAPPQLQPLTVDLKANNDTGRFYNAQGQRITQITFLQGSSSTGNDNPGQVQTVYFADSVPADEVVVSTEAPNLQGDSQILKVLPMPLGMTIDSPVTNWLINQRGEVNISLWSDEACTQPYTVPDELSDGIDVFLSSTPAGLFFSRQVEGEIVSENKFNIVAGTLAQNIPVFYAPFAPGEVKIKAGLSYGGGSYSGPGNQADVVWVLDHSGSMGDDQANIANNINNFAGQLNSSGISCRLGFNYYADSLLQRQSFSSGLFTSNPAEFASNLITVSQSCNGGTENTMGAVQNALGYPFSGNKYIVVVTDEPGDDNNLYQNTLNQANQLGAKINSIMNLYNSSYSSIDDLADNTGGLKIEITGDWSSILSTLAASIISGSTSFAIEAEKSIQAAAAGGVRTVILGGNSEIEAGMPEKFELTLIDQYGNPTTRNTSLNVNLSAVNTVDDLEQASDSGQFFAADANGNIVTADTINVITIPAGTSKVEFYYQDSRATSPDYQIALKVRSNAVDGSERGLFIYAGPSTAIGLTLEDYPVYYGLNIKGLETGKAIKGHEGEQTNLLSHMALPLTVYIKDASFWNNCVNQSSPIVINLSNTGTVGGFYLDAQQTQPVTQVEIPAGSFKAELFFVASGSGTGTILAQVPGLAQGNLGYTVGGPDRLSIHFPWYPEMEEESNQVIPGERKAFSVILTDAQGHPAIADHDIGFSLGGASFYLNNQSYETVNTAIIPTGYQGVLLFAEAGDAVGEVLIAVTPDSLTLSGSQAKLQVQLGSYTFSLGRGWNLLSAPVKLEKNKLGDILGADIAALELAYAFDPYTKQWSAVGANYEFEPMAAVYLKLKGAVNGRFYPATSLSGGYERQLKNGWNLLGPALDLSNYDEHYKAVTQVLASISGKYSQVVSPKTSRQNAWNYTSGGSSSYYDETPCMIAGGGYWIYLKDTASLAGLSYTPVEGPYCGPIYQDGVVRSLQEDTPYTSAIPEIPAAFAGKVVDPQGTVIDSATIQAVVDGVVRGEKTFSNGQFGLSPETLLIVQSLYDLNRKSISFLVNGHPAQETAVFSSGSLSSLTLTVDMVAPVPFTYQSVSVVNNTSIKLNFNQDIVNNRSDLQDLKKYLSFSADGKEFKPLAEGDSISISGSSLTVQFSAPITGSSNIIRLYSNSLKNTDGAVLSQTVTSAAFSAGDQVIDECFIATAAFGSKFEPSVALLRAFRDRYLLTNSFGAAFVDFYYQNSPPIARYIADNGSLKFMVRILLVPAIAMAYLLFHPALLTALLAGLFLLAAYRRRRTKIIAG